MRNRVRATLGFLAGFEAAARTLSFTVAATELSITQSAVSRQIKALENALAVTLFERFNRRLALTNAGAALQRTVTTMLRELESGLARLSPAHDANLVTVGTTVSFASLWLVSKLAEFRRLHPAVDVRISADNEIVDLRTRGIDVAIRFCRPEIAPEGAIPLSEEEVFPVCAPAIAGDPRHPLRLPRDLVHHVLLHLDDVRRWPWLDWSQWLAANGVPGLEAAGNIRLSHYDQLIQAAVEGEGVAMGRTPLVERFLRTGQLVAPLRGRAASRRKYFLILRDNVNPSPAVSAFSAWITATAQGSEVSVERTAIKAKRRSKRNNKALRSSSG